MAGGPIGPSSIYLGGASGKLFPNFHAGAGGNASAHDEGIGVMASLDADAAAELRFAMPPSIPTGTLKLMVRMLANATSGDVKFTVSDAASDNAESPSGATLSGESQSSATWGAGDNDKYKDVKVTLTTSPTANESLVVAITFNNTGWTLAQVLTCLVWILWE